MLHAQKYGLKKKVKSLAYPLCVAEFYNWEDKAFILEQHELSDKTEKLLHGESLSYAAYECRRRCFSSDI